MSRIGNQPVQLPSGVTLQVQDDAVTVKGPKGTLSHPLVEHVQLQVEGTTVQVGRDEDAKQARANHGLMRAVLRNMVHGVTQGFERTLEINGVGFRAEVRGKTLVLNLGYSHPIEFAIPEGVKVVIDKAGLLQITGIDRQQVGQVAAKIRSFRKPDSYKGKGVRYLGETVRLKPGKSAKK
jgi:large subunit ribosomal protein L6